MKSIAFGGSRILPRSFFPLVSRVVAGALLRGFAIRTGCARGADAAVVSAACSSAARLSVFCADNPTARYLARAAARGARIVSFAGGQPGIPFVARLAIRSRRCNAGATAAVFFLACPSSRGSLGAAADAIRCDIPVFVFCCGFVVAPDPPPGCTGSWQPSCLAGETCLRWQPAAEQPTLF